MTVYDSQCHRSSTVRMLSEHDIDRKDYVFWKKKHPDMPTKDLIDLIKSKKGSQ